MLVHPGLQFKSVERDTLISNRDFREVGPDFAVEPVAIHADIGGSISKPEQTWKDGWWRRDGQCHSRASTSKMGMSSASKSGSANTKMSSQVEEPAKKAVRKKAHLHFKVTAHYRRSLSNNNRNLGAIRAMQEDVPTPPELAAKKAILEAEARIPSHLTCTVEKVGYSGEEEPSFSKIVNGKIESVVEDASLDDYNKIEGVDYDADANFRSLKGAAESTQGEVRWAEFRRGRATEINYLESQRTGSLGELRETVQSLWHYKQEVEKIEKLDRVMTWRFQRRSSHLS